MSLPKDDDNNVRSGATQGASSAGLHVYRTVIEYGNQVVFYMDGDQRDTADASDLDAAGFADALGPDTLTIGA